ncbi:MAG: gamma-glutamyl-gamma-aminobutyrate hydrolase family protein, partial [Candidatus Curtissbacteria bacterium]|nr:gamma-glutamyl-gamma-aminobutyrate hydrolase family protein [Candidatus Curtissbacteria bacterium]
MIFIVDFGSQTAHLIGRRLEELGVDNKIVAPQDSYRATIKEKPQGIILSGGPASVYAKGAPTIDTQIFSLNIPILGICYGLQLMIHQLGGEVIPGKKEYGPAVLKLLTLPSTPSSGPRGNSQLSTELPQQFTVWMSHGDEVVKLPEDFSVIGSTGHVV